MATEVRHTINLILRQGKIQTTKSPLERFHVGERIRICSPAKYHLEYALRSFKRRSPQIFVTVVASTYRQEQPGLPFMKRTAMILSEPENNRNCYCQHLSTRTTGPTFMQRTAATLPSTLSVYWKYKRLRLHCYWSQQSPQHLFLQQHAIHSCNLRSPRPLRSKGGYSLRHWTWWAYPILIIGVEHFIDFLSAIYYSPGGVSSWYYQVISSFFAHLVLFLKKTDHWYLWSDHSEYRLVYRPR